MRTREQVIEEFAELMADSIVYGQVQYPKDLIADGFRTGVLKVKAKDPALEEYADKINKILGKLDETRNP